MEVRFVLNGSLRRSGSTLRISTELIDVESGNAIWTESYGRELTNGFDMQDEIIQQLIISLDATLLHGEQAAVWHQTLKYVDSLEHFYRGVEEFFRMNRDAQPASTQILRISNTEGSHNMVWPRSGLLYATGLMHSRNGLWNLLNLLLKRGNGLGRQSPRKMWMGRRTWL